MVLELGPMPVEIAKMRRCDPIWLSEMADDCVTDYLRELGAAASISGPATTVTAIAAASPPSTSR